MEAGIWLAEQRNQYVTLILYHKIKISDEERKIKNIRKNQHGKKKSRRRRYNGKEEND